MKIDVNKINFHPILKDIENMFWFFLLSIRALSDYDIQNILRKKNSMQEGYASFNHMLDKFNKTTNLKIEKAGNIATSRLNILNEMMFIGKAMAILGYEYLWSSKYKEFIKEDKEFLFLRYIRNGAAHDNKFNLKYVFGKNKGKWMIGEDEIIRWNGKEISRKLQDTNVFNDFISLSDIFLLINNFSDKLKEIDEAKKT